MKRKLALVMAMLMVLGTLPACSSNSGGSPSEKGENAVSGGSAGTEVGAVIETGDKINSTYTNNTPDANLPVTAVEDTLPLLWPVSLRPWTFFSCPTVLQLWFQRFIAKAC